MSHRFSKLLAVAGVSAALAIGGAGIAQASPDHSGQKHDHAACKNLSGKKKKECEKRHHHEKHHGTNHK
jgi:hypothetical protein